MGNRRKWQRVKSLSENRELRRYVESLEAAGTPEREIARAYFYADKHGLAALSNAGDGCVYFDIPTCGDWNCISPEHQVVVKE